MQQEILESFSNVSSPDNNAGWKELETVRLYDHVSPNIIYHYR